MKQYLILFLMVISLGLNAQENRLKIGKQLQKSKVPYSTVLTDTNNEQYYVQPGTNGQIYAIVNGVPTWINSSVTNTDTRIQYVGVLPSGEWQWNVINVLNGSVISSFNTPAQTVTNIVGNNYVNENGVSQPIVQNVTNTFTNGQLVTNVNGVVSSAVNIPNPKDSTVVTSSNGNIVVTENNNVFNLDFKYNCDSIKACQDIPTLTFTPIIVSGDTTGYQVVLELGGQVVDTDSFILPLDKDTNTNLNLTVENDSLKVEILNVITGNVLSTYYIDNLANKSDVLTSLTYNATTHSLVYLDELGATNTIPLDVATISYNALTNSLVYTDEKGVVTTLPLQDDTDVNNNITVVNDSLKIDLVNVITGNILSTTYIDNVVNKPLTAEMICDSIAANCGASLGNFTSVVNGDGSTTYTAPFTGNDGVTSNVGFTIAAIPTVDGSETKVTATGNVTVTGTGTIADPYVVGYTHVPSTLTQDQLTGDITHNNGSGVTTTVNVLSSDVGNNATVGSDGGVFVAANVDVVTTVTNTVTGNKIADYTNELGTVVPINETITTMSTVSGGVGAPDTLKYTNETGITSIVSPIIYGARHDLRLTSPIVERGSDSPTDSKGAQFLHNSYSHLNGFSDNWIGAGGALYPTLRIQNDGKVWMYSDGINTDLNGKASFYFNPDGYGKLNFGYNFMNVITTLGEGSVNFGRSGNSTGNYAFNTAQNGSASGVYSFNAGYQGLASAIGAVNLGYQGVASGAASFNTGSLGIASNNNATNLGGIGKATGEYSFNSGFLGVSSSLSSVNMGDEGNASGIYSLNFGKKGIASNPYAINLGNSGTSSNYAAINFGEMGTASGFASLNFGNNGIASGSGSINLAKDGIASGNSSFNTALEGIANSYAQTNLGLFPVIFTGQDPSGGVPTDVLLNIGSGSSGFDRRSVLTQLKNGNTLIFASNVSNTELDVTPVAALEVISANNGLLVPRMDAAQITAWQTGFNTTTHVNGIGTLGQAHSRQGEMVYNLATSQNTQARWNGTSWIFVTW